MECSIDPNEIPEVPANKFLLRSSPADKERTDRDISRRQRNKDADTFEGRQVKGRGALRFTRRRSRSSTPPHWRREQERLRPLNQKRAEELENRSSSPGGRTKHRRPFEERERRSGWRRSRSRSRSRSGDRRSDRRLREAFSVTEKRRHEERTSDVESDFESQPSDNLTRRLKSAVVHRESAPGKDTHLTHQEHDESEKLN